MPKNSLADMVMKDLNLIVKGLKMKKVLILGVNGFIGHHLSNCILANTNWEVYGMDMSSERICDLIGHERFHFFEGDITINRDITGSVNREPKTWDRILLKCHG